MNRRDLGVQDKSMSSVIALTRIHLLWKNAVRRLLFVPFLLWQFLPAISEAGSVQMSPDMLLGSDFESTPMKIVTRGNLPVSIYYEGGDTSDRFAEVIPDPTKRGNSVLHFWLKHARVGGQKSGKTKGRIQLVTGELNVSEAYQRSKMYLHPDFEHYRSFPGQNGWFTINELWFGLKWKDHPYPFRIRLEIGKQKGVGQPLRFLAFGEISTGGPVRQGTWRAVWKSINRVYEVPVGEWLDMEVGYKEGDRNTGRFFVAVKRESESSMTTVIDVHDWTYHPQAPAPVPLTVWNPLKMYTSSKIIDHVRNEGGVLQIYWDDLEIIKRWPR